MSLFDEIIFDESGKVEIAGVEWERHWWETPSIRRLSSKAKSPVAHFSLSEMGDKWVKLTAHAKGHPEYEQQFDSLVNACEALKSFAWEIREAAGIKWIKTGEWNDGNIRKKFAVMLSRSDKVEISLYENGAVSGIYREIHSAQGFFKLDLFSTSDRRIESFEEGVALALSAPTIVFSIAASHQDGIKYQAAELNESSNGKG